MVNALNVVMDLIYKNLYFSILLVYSFVNSKNKNTNGKGYYLIMWYSRNSRCHWQTCHQEESDDACKCDKADRRNRDIMHRTMKFWNIHFSFQIWHLRIRWHLMVALRIITAFIYLLYRFSYQISTLFNRSWRYFQFTNLRK